MTPLEAPKAIILAVNISVYALYMILFISSTYVLTKGNGLSLFKWKFATMVALFLPITVAMGLVVALQFIPQERQPNFIHIAYSGLAMFAHAIAEFVLMHRCFTLWDRRIAVVVIPMILLLIASLCGSIRVAAVHTSLSQRLPSNSDVYMLMVTHGLVLLGNLLLTCLIFTKLSMLIRQGKEVYGKVIRTRSAALFAISIDAGLIYTLFLIGIMALFSLIRRYPTSLPISTATSALLPATTQAAGISATLIILRAILVERDASHLATRAVDIEKPVWTTHAQGALPRPSVSADSDADTILSFESHHPIIASRSTTPMRTRNRSNISLPKSAYSGRSYNPVMDSTGKSWI